MVRAEWKAARRDRRKQPAFGGFSQTRNFFPNFSSNIVWRRFVTIFYWIFFKILSFICTNSNQKKKTSHKNIMKRSRRDGNTKTATPLFWLVGGNCSQKQLFNHFTLIRKKEILENACSNSNSSKECSSSSKRRPRSISRTPASAFEEPCQWEK